MELQLEFIFAFIALGATAGFFAGLLGIGGGAIMVPVLTSLFYALDLPAELCLPLALGTAMATIIPTSAVSAYTHYRHGAVDWSLVWRMALSMAVGAGIASQVVVYVPVKVLALVFSVFIFYVALSMWFKKASSKQAPISVNNTLLYCAGFGIGSFSSFLAIGGGSLSVPLFNSIGIPMQRAIATSAALGLAISGAGALGFALNQSLAHDVSNTLGLVYLPAFALMSIASIVLVPLGAICTHRLPVGLVKKIFALLLLGLATKMITTIY